MTLRTDAELRFALLRSCVELMQRYATDGREQNRPWFTAWREMHADLVGFASRPDPTVFVYIGIDAGSDLEAHSGAMCTVLNELGAGECDPGCHPMYRVRFADGFETDAFPEEIGR